MFKTISEYYRAIKALISVKGEIKKMKLSELSTSEGRMALLLNIVSVYSAVHGFIPPALTAKIAVVSLGVYTVGRAIVKAAEAVVKLTSSTKDDAVVEEVGKLLDAAVGKSTEEPPAPKP